MDDTEVDAYLARIGAARPERAGSDGLRDLSLRHLTTVPFENLSIHLGEDIVLEEKALLDKVVHRRRGGFCYELNGLFGALLSALGYRVTLMSARVFNGTEAGPPFDHLALRVETPAPWLVDVGFGDHSHFPLRLGTSTEQDDPAGTFTILETADGDLDVLKDGEPQYRLEQRPRELADFVPACWWQRTSPDSHFTRGPICSRLTEDGRISIGGRTLIRTVDRQRYETALESDTELLAAYRTHFGITLDRVRGAAATE
ncbi:arylamine N-acetyltransferase family protein [Wenjunlia tyrosinilytica]|uniref:N-hydroxyarylamine O-acetyltransferase n=1 Tax=Wenjunlia tyrosinilytica TaxID=1544741 RepID=A0A917ZTG2_9ACTN|nr:arylamine N-acetyltransferase [Wenjunlia tyrosinilytica]GGO90833.1 N-hydroxyarylamine O-acetyltransferase [Wenjunlia tyrosinilytica]